MKPRRPTPLPLCLAALFGLFLGFSLNSFSTFSYPDDHERLEQLELCQKPTATTSKPTTTVVSVVIVTVANINNTIISIQTENGRGGS
jgi:hypothetical protein